MDYLSDYLCMTGTLSFHVDVGGWKDVLETNVDERTTSTEMLHILARTTKGVDGVIGAQLKRMIEFGKVETVLQEAPVAKSAAELGKTIAFLNTRKMSQVVNDVSALPGYQSKEQSEMGQFIRLYVTRRLLAQAGMYVNYAGVFSEIKGKNEGSIQLISNNKQWPCVKKMAMEETTSPRTIMEFMGSFVVSMDNKIESYLSKLVDLNKIDEALANGPQGKTASDLDKLFLFLDGHELKQAISSLTKDAQLEKWLHVYACRNALEKCKIFVKYSQVEIPGLKRLLKKKKK